MRVLSFERGGAKSVDLFLGVKVRHTHTHSNKYFSPFHPLPHCISLSPYLSLYRITSWPFLSLSLSLSLLKSYVYLIPEKYLRGVLYSVLLWVSGSLQERALCFCRVGSPPVIWIERRNLVMMTS